MIIEKLIFAKIKTFGDRKEVLAINLLLVMIAGQLSFFPL
jgi:hypothetical protein